MSTPSIDFKTEYILAEVKERLRRHPGDAPWSCVECYHNRPCKDRQILKAAEANLLLRIAQDVK